MILAGGRSTLVAGILHGGGAAGGAAGTTLGEIFIAGTGAGAAGAAGNDEMNGKDDQCGAKSIF